MAVTAWMGILASLHACAAIRLPILAAFAMGVGGTSRRRAPLLATLLAAGLIGGTVFLGMTATPVGEGARQTLQASKQTFWVFGGCLIAVGILLSGLIDSQLLPERGRKLWERVVRVDALGALLLGFGLGLLQTAACPTCRTELLAIVGAAPVPGSSGSGLNLLVGFAAGQSLIAWFVVILMGLVKPSLLTWLKTRMCSAEPRARLLAGNLLVVLGIYFVIVG